MSDHDEDTDRTVAIVVAIVLTAIIIDYMVGHIL